MVPMSKKQWSKKELRRLNPNSKSNAFALKFYAEQLPYGAQAFLDALAQLDKSVVYVIAILHDRDEVTDGIWHVALEKPHWHVLVKFVDRKKKVRVYQVLNWLKIYFRPGIDDLLLQNNAIETIGCFQSYCVYLTHETEDAIAENKEFYDLSELHSNLSLEEIKMIREGYIRISNANTKVTMSEMASLDDEAFQLGYDLKNFSDWYNALPFSVRSQSKMKTIRESYARGSESRLEKDNKVNRLCVFIKGASNTGKTYASIKTLIDKQVLVVGGGGTGKFDLLRPDHDVIIIDDDLCPNLLNMSDNFMRHAYKRQNGNPIWAGEYFIVTSNLSFIEWVRACGVKNEQQLQAVMTRFFICEIRQNENNVNYLALAQPSTRGTIEEQCLRADRFVDFQNKFNAIMSTYTPSLTGVNYDAILDDAYANYDYFSGNNLAQLICSRDGCFSTIVANPMLQQKRQYEENKDSYYLYETPNTKSTNTNDKEEFI